MSAGPSTTASYANRGTLHHQREYSIIFKKDTDGEFTILDIEPRQPLGHGQTCPSVLRLFAWVLCVCAMVGALGGAYWIYVDFDYHRRIHWIISNLIAFLALIALVEPLMISAQSYQAAYFDRRINVWDWLIPIQQPIQIRGYSSREAEAEAAELAERRTFDERYRPVDMISLKLAYQAASAHKV